MVFVIKFASKRESRVSRVTIDQAAVPNEMEKKIMKGINNID